MTEKMEKIRELLAKEPYGIVETMTPETIIKELPEWDSFKHLSFLIEIEKTFNVEITPEEVKAIITMQDLMEKLR